MQDLQPAAELLSLRRQKILLLLERDGKVMAAELSRHFAASEDTIRRDLAEQDAPSADIDSYRQLGIEVLLA